MNCCLCQKPMTTKQQIEFHHLIYKSQGGRKTAPAHKECHRNFHRTQGDFQVWGRIGGKITAMTKQWAFNLKHVKNHPAFETQRKFYLAFYAR